MIRQDDPTLVGEIKVLRRIPPKADRVTWDESGTPIPSSQNFRDNRDDELSMFIASETTPEQVLQGLDGYGLVGCDQSTPGIFRENEALPKRFG
jgi:hypothetical protein